MLRHEPSHGLDSPDPRRRPGRLRRLVRRLPRRRVPARPRQGRGARPAALPDRPGPRRASACSTGASRPTPRSGWSSSTPRFGPMVKLERDVVRHQQGGEVGGHRRSGAVPRARRPRRRVPARTTAAYLVGKLAETISLCLIGRGGVIAGAATGSLHGGALVRRDRVGGVRARRGHSARARSPADVAGRSRSPSGSRQLAHGCVRASDVRTRSRGRAPATSCACAMERLRADSRAAVRAARDRGVRQAARLRRALHGAHRAGDPPRAGDDAARLHAHHHGRARRPAPRRHRRRRRLARRAAHRQRRARGRGRGRGDRVPPARPLVPAPRRCRRRARTTGASAADVDVSRRRLRSRLARSGAAVR